MRTLFIGILGTVLLAGCAQNTEQPVTPTTDERAAAVQPTETRMHDIEFYLIQGEVPGAIKQVMADNAGSEELEAARLRANAATSQPADGARLSNEATTADNAGAANKIAGLAANPVQQNSFYIEVWGDAQQQQTQELRQQIEQVQTATQDIRSVVDIMLDLQLQWTQTMKVLSDLTDSLKDVLKASLVPATTPTPATE